MSDDLAISMNSQGKILSRHGDPSWDMSPFFGYSNIWKFDSRIPADTSPQIRGELIAIFKRLMLWAMYAKGESYSPSTLQAYYWLVWHLIRFCCTNALSPLSLKENLSCISLLGESLSSVKSLGKTAEFFHSVYLGREILGFTILTLPQLETLASNGKLGEGYRQTACIPERIFFAIFDKSFDIVSNFLKNYDSVRDMHDLCVEFKTEARQSGEAAGQLNDESFSEKYGFSFTEYLEGNGLMQVIRPCALGNKVNLMAFNSYLSRVRFAAKILIFALTGMRRGELLQLRFGCLSKHEDPKFGEVFFVNGVTTKTQRNPNASWISSADVELAINAVERLDQMLAYRPDLPKKYQQIFKTELLFGSYPAPWNPFDFEKLEKRGIVRGYNIQMLPLKGLFDEEEFRITSADFEQALRLTPNLDRKIFGVGKIWAFNWHQFRRTFICMGLDKGVSVAAMSWQAKHGGAAITEYYGKNYFRMPVPKSITKEFLEEQANLLELTIKELSSDRYVPLVDKNRIAERVISESDEKGMRELIQNGQISARRTALGLCLNREPCPFGGWDHIADCDGCIHARADRAMKPRADAMLSLIDADLAACGPADDLLRQSLDAQQAAVLVFRRAMERGEHGQNRQA
ncbi:hypothetical protein [Variovorax gossypii]